MTSIIYALIIAFILFEFIILLAYAKDIRAFWNRKFFKRSHLEKFPAGAVPVLVNPVIKASVNANTLIRVK